MAVRTDEITALLRQQILNFTVAPTQIDVGEVMEIGDGIALVSGLQGAMAGELVEFPNSRKSNAIVDFVDFSQTVRRILGDDCYTVYEPDRH